MSPTIETPNGPVTIRPGVEPDAPAFRALRLEALHNHPEAFGSAYEDYVEKPMSHWEERLRIQDSETMLFFAVHAGQLVGMCGIQRGASQKTRHNSMIFSVYVQPQWRGQGIAEGLIQACIDWARPLGTTIVRLAVVTTNTAAIRCYTRCGFKEYGLEPSMIYHNGVMYDELLMLREL